MARDSYLDGFISRTAYTDWLWGIAVGLAAGAVVASAVAAGLWHEIWPGGDLSMLRDHALYVWSDGLPAWAAWIYSRGYALHATMIFIPASLAGLSVAGGITWVMWPKRRRVLVKHIRGPILAYWHPAEKIGRRLAKTEGVPGVRLHPGFPLPLARETQHIIYTGTTGSGKTQGIMRLLNAIRTRDPGARIMIHDTKGDYIQSAPRGVLIGPTDARGVAWDIAADISSDLDAELVASVTILETKDPFWSSAARLVLTGMLLHCRQTHGQNWTWAHLAALLDLPSAELQQVLIDAHPVIGRRLDPSKTTDSIMMTVVASLSWIRHLAAAWPDGSRAISVSAWVAGTTRAKTIIFQHYDESASLARPIIAAMVSLAARRLLSLQDDAEREVWLLLDELPALPRIDALPALLERGRSKGVRVVLAYQSYSQLIDVYGRETTQTIESLCGTSIFFRSPAGETADHISELIGETEDEVPTPTTQHTQDGRGSVSHAMQRRTEPLVRPEEISSLPQPAAEGGVPGYLVVSGWTHVLRLTWPFIAVEKRRVAHQPAAWTTGGGGPPPGDVGGEPVPVPVPGPAPDLPPAQTQEPDIDPDDLLRDAVAADAAHEPEPIDPDDLADAVEAETLAAGAAVGGLAADTIDPALLAIDVADAVESVMPADPAPAEPVLLAAPAAPRKSKKQRLAERLRSGLDTAADKDRDL